jgi:tRNA A-37 threonylcarbamoyl transferase component Bud32
MVLMDINPDYRQFLEARGLAAPERLLSLPALNVGGHPDRQVSLVQLGDGPTAINAFLKREHRVSWKVRLRNWWAGFGWTSNSIREARLLQDLRAAGIECPQTIAADEKNGGPAFVLVRQLPGAVDLRQFLRDWIPESHCQRRGFFRSVGQALARVHAADFNHPDLYSKHVVVDPSSRNVYFLDWQRARRWRRLSWRRRFHDLAALHATLADDLASPRDRLACLRGYFGNNATTKAQLRRAITDIRCRAVRLLSRRRIRELRQMPLPFAAQNAIWLHGEALCMTRECHTLLGGQIPAWLLAAAQGARAGSGVATSIVRLPEGRSGTLVRRSARRSHRLKTWLRRSAATSPELRQAAVLFRLQRYGIATPRLLAFGQRFLPGRAESFLLTEAITGGVGLVDWLIGRRRAQDNGLRQQIIREAVAMVRRIHEADCCLVRPGEKDTCPLVVVQNEAQEKPVVMLGDVTGVVTKRRLRPDRALRDLAAMRRWLAAVTDGRSHARAIA